MLIDEFYRIGADAIHEHDFNRSFTVTSVVPSWSGPVVQWKPIKGKRPPPDPEFDRLRPAAILDALVRTLAHRWVHGRPLCPLDWKERLTSGMPQLFPFEPEVGNGWVWLIAAAANHLSVVDTCNDMRTHDLKQKYGTLRWDIASMEFYQQVDEYTSCVDRLSGYICEDCGDPGAIQSLNGWDRCVCSRHAVPSIR